MDKIDGAREIPGDYSTMYMISPGQLTGTQWMKGLDSERKAEREELRMGLYMISGTLLPGRVNRSEEATKENRCNQKHGEKAGLVIIKKSN